MFRRKTTAAEMEQANPTAVAAAASIGKLFMKKGNQPENKQKSTYRSASMTNLRKPTASRRMSSISSTSSESVRGKGRGNSGKLNSLNQRSSMGRENVPNPSPKKASLHKSSSHYRTSSLPNQRGQSSRNNSGLQREKSKKHQRISYDEAQRTFKDFGGPQAKGILTNRQRPNNSSGSPPLKTMRKYIPGPNGLIAIEVPIEKPNKINTSRSLRRSNSAHSTLNVKNCSPIRKKVSQESLHSQPKGTSSLRNTSNSQRKQGEEPKLSKTSTTNINVPLIETQVREETDQELRLENSNTSESDTVVNSENNVEKPSSLSSENDDLRKLIDGNIELETFIKEEENGKSSKSSQENVVVNRLITEKGVEKLNAEHKMATVDGEKPSNSDKVYRMVAEKPECEEQNSLMEKHPLSKAENLDKQVERLDHDFSNDSSSLKESADNRSSESADHTQMSDITCSPAQDPNKKPSSIQDSDISEGIKSTVKAKKEDNPSVELSPTSTYSKEESIGDPNDEYFDTTDKETQKANEQIPSHKNHDHMQAESTPSLAQYLRTSNTYLSPKNPPNQAGQEKLLKPEINMVSVAKAVTPIKSALKKSSGLSNHNSSMYSDSSPANGAYLSLTTAENTRLNAQMTIPDSVSRRTSVKRSSVKRPQSVGQFKNNRSSSPSPPEKVNNKRHSAIPLGTPEKANPQRNSVAASFSKTTQQSQEPTNVPGPIGQKKFKSKTDNKSTNTNIKRGSQIVQNDKHLTKDVSNVLYPKEPPPRKSSFEKMRSNESHLGFKKLSLRNGTSEEALNDCYVAHANESNANVSQTETAREFFKSLGHPSRFADSDSDDDSQFLSQSSSKHNAETESSKVGNSRSGISNKGAFSLFKSKNKKKENDVTSSEISRPNHNIINPAAQSTKVSKKLSGASLRAASEALPAKAASPPMSNRLRFSSNPGNSESRHSQSQEINDTREKKGGAFGKKLKKIFGKKK
ncbi:hypothetical protein SKDZ_13G2120 [Saccharomyces kudriavzevii ZP591]|nr:hypothetical protein SKDZ_13G2120 [Saccharomyces kudriavzevii ZP591]